MNLTPQEMPINTRNQMLLTTNTFLSHVEDRVCRAELSLCVTALTVMSALQLLCYISVTQDLNSSLVRISSTIQDIKVKRNCQFSKILCTSSVLCSRIIIIFTHQCFIVSKQRINGNQ